MERSRYSLYLLLFAFLFIACEKEAEETTAPPVYPEKIEIKSGNKQHGRLNTSLPIPIKVRIMDSKRDPMQATVYFEVKAGGGSVSTQSIQTDNNGYAQTNWKLGVQDTTQILQVKARKADGQFLENPVEFLATFPGYCPPSVTDIDGNVYKTVKIGSQCWIQENLKTTKFRNGDAIAELKGSNNNNGGYAYYNNNPANNIYGKLYTWNTAVDLRCLCPGGFRVPNTNDWFKLGMYVQGDGGKLKSVNSWNTPNVGATNSTGFTGLPGGWRSGSGTFNYLGDQGFWWSSTFNNSPVFSGFATHFFLQSGAIGFLSAQTGSGDAVSVRCIGEY